MIFECKDCRKQFKDSLDRLSGFTVTVKIPQFNETTGRATDHAVHSAAYIGLCEDCVNKMLSGLKEASASKIEYLGRVVECIFQNDNEQEYYKEKKL
jgi:hypothetical protein